MWLKTYGEREEGTQAMYYARPGGAEPEAERRRWAGQFANDIVVLDQRRGPRHLGPERHEAQVAHGGQAEPRQQHAEEAHGRANANQPVRDHRVRGPQRSSGDPYCLGQGLCREKNTS